MDAAADVGVTARKTRARSSPARGAMRERLCEAAARIFVAEGEAALSMRRLAAEVGCSPMAPYRHFADKHALLAAIAARELARQADNLAGSAAGDVREMMRGYVRWALRYPERFRLTFGRWEREDAGLGAAAGGARAALVRAVTGAQARGELPRGDPERLSALLLALAHGAADQALAGHLSATGKGAADAEDLVADLFAYLRASVR